jgi:hypothetical protein
MKKNHGGRSMTAAVDVDLESAKVNETTLRHGDGSLLGGSQIGQQQAQRDQQQSFQHRGSPRDS